LSYKNTYNSNVQPPAPYAKVTIIHPTKKNQSVDDDALVDSGASGTCITKWIVERLMLIPNNMVQSYDYQGNLVGTKPTYQVKVSFGKFTFVVNAAETDGGTIIGRDILNQLTTILKGKTKQLEMI